MSSCGNLCSPWDFSSKRQVLHFSSWSAVLAPLEESAPSKEINGRWFVSSSQKEGLIYKALLGCRDQRATSLNSLYVWAHGDGHGPDQAFKRSVLHILYRYRISVECVLLLSRQCWRPYNISVQLRDCYCRLHMVFEMVSHHPSAVFLKEMSWICHTYSVEPTLILLTFLYLFQKTRTCFLKDTVCSVQASC